MIRGIYAEKELQASVVIVNFVMLSVVILSVVMLSVVILTVIMLSVMAPMEGSAHINTVMLHSCKLDSSSKITDLDGSQKVT